MNLYEVNAKCGHVGMNKYTVKTFAVVAESGKQAAAIVRQKPRVKHTQKNAILSVSSISTNRYNEIINAYYCDPYFRCYNIQDQRRDAVVEVHPEDWKHPIDIEEESKRPYYYGKKAIRHAKRYMNNYIDLERYAV